MSALVDEAIDRAGLTDVLEARRTGPISPGQLERLRGADLLVLGALADRVRADECGPGVRIFTGAPGAGDAPARLLPEEGSGLTGLDLLREVALTRLSAKRGANVRIDWTRTGLELAQIALGFGANELQGRISDKRGLPLAEGDTLGVGKKSNREAAEVVKRRELEGLVRRAGRNPTFTGEEIP